MFKDVALDKTPAGPVLARCHIGILPETFYKMRLIEKIAFIRYLSQRKIAMVDEMY